MTSHMQTINNCKEDLTIIKEKVNHVENGINEVSLIVQEILLKFKDWEKNIQRIDNEYKEKLIELNNNNYWFYK